MSESAAVIAEIATDTFEFALYFWPISLGMLVLGLVALGAAWHSRNQSLRKRPLVFLIPYGMPLVILLIGTLLRYDGPPHPNWREPPAWRGWVLLASLVLSLVFVVRGVVVMRGARLRSAAGLVPALWLAVCTYFPCGFAIAGVGP